MPPGLDRRKRAAAAAAAPVYDTSPAGRLALAERLWGWIPHPGQRAFLTLSLPDGSEPRTLVAACGRRWGKTEALGCDVATRILTEPDLGQMGVAPTRDQSEGLYDSVEEKLRELLDDPDKRADVVAQFPHLEMLEFKRSPYPLIRNRQSGQLVFWVRAAGRKGRNLRGRGTTRKLKRFRVIIDERAYVDDEAVEQAIKPMLATSPGGGQLVEISSPYRKRGGFYEDFLRGEREYKRYRSVRLPSSQNPLVDAEFLAEQQETMSDAAYRAEYLAEFLDAAGIVFLEGDIALAICDDDQGIAPLWGVKYVAGLDLARRGDYTVLSILAIGPDRLRLVKLFRIQGLGYALQLERVVEELIRWGVCRICPDRTGVGDAVVETLVAILAAKRVKCEVDEFIFTGPSKAALIDRLVIALARKLLQFPPHPALLSELRNFEAIPTASGHERLAAAGSGHDDCVCSLALAVYAAAPLFSVDRSTRALVGAVTPSSRKKDDGWQFSTNSETWSVGLPLVALLLQLQTLQALRLLSIAYRSELGRRAGASLASSLRSIRRFTRSAD